MVGKTTPGRELTGIAGLDTMLGGGLLPGDATLVAGSPGTGKTTLGLHFIAAGVEAGEPGVFVTFEYLPQQLYRDAAAKGFALREWDDAGKVRVICTTPDVLLARSPGGDSILDEAVRSVGARRLVIDSMAHFEFAQPDTQGLRTEMAGLLNHLRLLDVTTLLTHEVPQIVGPTVNISSWGLEFLVDNLILLRYVELEGVMDKALNVLKFRGGDHDRSYRVLRTTSRGIVVEAGFVGVENISTGSARRGLADRAKDLI
jgi:circadian clock protein KaiC